MNCRGTIDWRQLLHSTYRRLALSDDLPWKQDFDAFASARYIQESSSRIFVCPTGGPIALVSLFKTDVNDPSVEKSGTTATLQSRLKIYSCFGTRLADCRWTHVGLVNAGWTSNEQFISVHRDGIVRVFNLFAELKCSFNLRPTVTTRGEVWWNQGFGASRATTWLQASEISSLNGFHRQRTKVQGNKSDKQVKAVALADQQGSSGRTVALLALESGLLLAVWNTGHRIVVLDLQDTTDCELRFRSIAFSATNRFVSFLTDDGFMIIISGETMIQALYESTGHDLSVKATVVTSPAMNACQLSWVGNHCVAMTVDTPTFHNKDQQCLFVGGPGSKWIDYTYQGYLVIQTELNGLRFWQNSLVGFIHMATSETESVFGPGSSDPAGMLCFAYQQRNSKSFSYESIDMQEEEDSLLEQASLQEYDGCTKSNLASSLASEAELQEKKLDQVYEDVLKRDKLQQSDLHYLFYSTQWKIQSSIPHILGRGNSTDEELEVYLKSISEKEKGTYATSTLIQIDSETALETTLMAIEDEWRPESVKACLWTVHSLTDVISRDIRAWAKCRFLQLCRDFRLLFAITSKPAEIALTYFDFKREGLSKITERRREYDLALEIANAYRVPSLSTDESQVFNTRFMNVHEGSNLDFNWLASVRNEIRLNVATIVKRIILEYISDMMIGSKTGDNITISDATILEEIEKKAGDVIERDVSLARQAAWAASRHSRVNLAKSLIAREPNPRIKLYFDYSVRDYPQMLLDAVETGSSNNLDFFLDTSLPDVLTSRPPISQSSLSQGSSNPQFPGNDKSRIEYYGFQIQKWIKDWTLAHSNSTNSTGIALAPVSLTAQYCLRLKLLQKFVLFVLRAKPWFAIAPEGLQLNLSPHFTAFKVMAKCLGFRRELIWCSIYQTYFNAYLILKNSLTNTHHHSTDTSTAARFIINERYLRAIEPNAPGKPSNKPGGKNNSAESTATVVGNDADGGSAATSSSKFISSLMSAPLHSLTNVVLLNAPNGGSGTNVGSGSQHLSKHPYLLRKDVWETAQKNLRQIRSVCKPTSKAVSKISQVEERLSDEVFNHHDSAGEQTDFADFLAEQIELSTFQVRLGETCRKEGSKIASFVGFGSSRPKQRIQQHIASIEWETFALNETGYMLTLNSCLIPNGEDLLTEFKSKFGIDKKLLCLWKLKALSERQQWQTFMDCSKEAVKSVPLVTVYKTGSSSRGLTFAAALTNLSSGGGGTSDSAGNSNSSLSIQTGPQFAAFIKDRYGTKMADSSSLTATLSSVLQVLPGRQSSNAMMATDFAPVLPPAGRQGNACVICPTLLPAASFSRMNVLEFVTLAHLYNRTDIALALLPYVAPPTMRQKWGLTLGLKDTSHVESFCRDAIEAALAKSSSDSVQVAGLGSSTFVTSLMSMGSKNNSGNNLGTVATPFPSLMMGTGSPSDGVNAPGRDQQGIINEGDLQARNELDYLLGFQ